MSIFDGYKNKDKRQTQRKMMEFQAKLKSRFHQTQHDACVEYNDYLKGSYKNPLTLKSQYSKARNAVNKFLLDNQVSEKQVKRCRAVFVLPSKVVKEINERYNQSVVKKNKTQIIITLKEARENIRQAETLLEDANSHYIKIMIAVAVVTGRRFYEIGCTAKFEREANNETSLLFTGQAKTRKNEAHESFYIPCLTTPELAVKGIETIRKAKPELTEFDYIAFNNRMSRQINTKLAEISLHGIKQPKDTRNLYVAYCLKKFRHNGISESAYASGILGHGEDDLDTSKSYMTHCVVE